MSRGPHLGHLYGCYPESELLGFPQGPGRTDVCKSALEEDACPQMKAFRPSPETMHQKTSAPISSSHSHGLKSGVFRLIKQR